MNKCIHCERLAVGSFKYAFKSSGLNFCGYIFGFYLMRLIFEINTVSRINSFFNMKSGL